MTRSQLASYVTADKVLDYAHIEVIPQSGSFGALLPDIQIADALHDGFGLNAVTPRRGELVRLDAMSWA